MSKHAIEKHVRSASAAVAAVLAAMSAAVAGELDVAHEALRDGLWDVARAHAAKVEGDDAKLVVLESYAREGRWSDMLGAISSEANSTAPGVAYYRALALYETGKKSESLAELSARAFSNTVYAAAAERLRARAALDAGDTAEALRISRESGFADADVDSRMAAADILSAAGDEKGAAALWRSVAADTNADERAAVAAAVNIGDAALLRSAYGRVADASLRRTAGLRLGRLLLEDKATFAEGTNLVFAIAKDAPDADGAREAYVAAADALLAAEMWQAAADAYRCVLETWPAAASDAQVQEGRGWALRKLARAEESVEAFARAEECATNDETRASAALAQGDVLAEAGRGEEAMAKYRMVLARFPKTAAGQKLEDVVKRRETEAEARELYKGYRFREAQEKFAALAKDDPESAPRMEFMEALCLYGQGRDAEALERVRAISSGGSDAEIRSEATLWLAKHAFFRRRWAESREMFANYATNMAPKSAQAPAALLWAARAAFAENEFQSAVDFVSRLAKDYPDSPEKARGCLVQGEALIELRRFDEAVLVLEQTVIADGTPADERTRAQVLKADALFAMGADNPARYRAALDAYRAVRLGESLPPGLRLAASFKIGRTLEKLGRLDEAIDEYYSNVVLAYRDSRLSGVRFDDEASAFFARAAFRLADEYESRGMDYQAVRVLQLVSASDAPAADEAGRRIDRIQTKGKFL